LGGEDLNQDDRADPAASFAARLQQRRTVGSDACGTDADGNSAPS
jgi:hypothetical protein